MKYKQFTTIYLLLTLFSLSLLLINPNKASADVACPAPWGIGSTDSTGKPTSGLFGEAIVTNGGEVWVDPDGQGGQEGFYAYCNSSLWSQSCSWVCDRPTASDLSLCQSPSASQVCWPQYITPPTPSTCGGNGDACCAGNTCNSGFTCSSNLPQGGGQCFTTPVVTVGNEPCTSDSECSYGFYCDFYQGWTCQYAGSNGYCGSAATTFAYDITPEEYPWYANSFCYAGSPTPNPPLPFPTYGNPTNWTCPKFDPLNVGYQDVSCSAFRRPYPPTIAVDANPLSIFSGNSSFLSWTITGAGPITCTGTNMPAGNWSSGGSSSNVSTGALFSTKTFRLDCTNPSGATVSDDATVTVGSAPVNGSCGTANKTYAYNASDYGVDTFCGAGSLSWIGPGVSGSFPAQGASKTWTCAGQNGGSSSPTCTASRNNPPVSLVVEVTASGQGTVRSTSVVPAQSSINCNSTCSASYELNTQITLIAEPSSPSRIFIGWSGDCSGTNNTCTLTVNSAKSVTARFGLNPNYKEF